MGLKTENVTKSIVFLLLFKGSRPNESFRSGGLGVVLAWKKCRKVMFLIKDALRLYSELCFLPRRGIELRWQVKWVCGGA